MEKQDNIIKKEGKHILYEECGSEKDVEQFLDAAKYLQDPDN